MRIAQPIGLAYPKSLERSPCRCPIPSMHRRFALCGRLATTVLSFSLIKPRTGCKPASLSPLLLADAFRLATESTSGHIRFAAIERIISRERRSLAASEEDTFKNLFVILARDHTSWSGWLAVWNRYPLRNPHMQGALGRALARSTTSAIRAYVDSIELSTSPAEGRACVAACLAEFRCRATPPRRRALWSRAFERWQAWDFAAAEGQELKTRERSELDYAVVRWLVECAEPTLLTAEIDAFADRLKALEANWHSSVASLIGGFNRLLSRHQIFAFARSRTRDNSSNWLCNQEVFTPEIAATTFVRLRYFCNEP